MVLRNRSDALGPSARTGIRPPVSRAEDRPLTAIPVGPGGRADDASPGRGPRKGNAVSIACDDLDRPAPRAPSGAGRVGRPAGWDRAGGRGLSGRDVRLEFITSLFFGPLYLHPRTIIMTTVAPVSHQSVRVASADDRCVKV